MTGFKKHSEFGWVDEVKHQSIEYSLPEVARPVLRRALGEPAWQHSNEMSSREWAQIWREYGEWDDWNQVKEEERVEREQGS